MAKKEHRIIIHLRCSVCRSQNYTTKKSKLNDAEKLVVKKYCSKCRKHTEHKESTRLK